MLGISAQLGIPTIAAAPSAATVAISVLICVCVCLLMLGALQCELIPAPFGLVDSLRRFFRACCGKHWYDVLTNSVPCGMSRNISPHHIGGCAEPRLRMLCYQFPAAHLPIPRVPSGVICSHLGVDSIPSNHDLFAATTQSHSPTTHPTTDRYHAYPTATAPPSRPRLQLGPRGLRA